MVDTTNFNDGGGFYGDAGGNFGWDRNLHLVERFSLFDPDTLLYQFEIDNPTAFTRPWKGELTMTRTTGNIYEFACHEANYSLENMLRGFRAAETQARRPVVAAVRTAATVPAPVREAPPRTRDAGRCRRARRCRSGRSR